ncbi:MAG: GNAT family N-acetyltransferase, partial [Armatimonadota bacterium]
MEVVGYRSDMAGEVSSVYDEAVRDVPHCYPVSEDAFAAELAAAAGGESSHERLHSEAAFVGSEAGRIIAFAHVGVERPKEEGEADQGVIRFLWYPRGRRRIGQSLLAAAEDHLRGRGMSRAFAFPHDWRYRFYHFKNAYLSDHLDHVQALLAFNDYRRSFGEAFLDWPDYDPVVPLPTEIEAEIRVEERPGRGRRPGLRVSAHGDGKQLGECVSLSAAE